MPDAELVAGDIAVHGEVAYPEEEPDVAAFGNIPGEPVPDHRHKDHAEGGGVEREVEKVS
jgi:hypothetical protein